MPQALPTPAVRISASGGVIAFPAKSGRIALVSDSKLTRLCAADELPEGEVTRVDVDVNRTLAVYHVNGAFYATDDGCTHAEASLSEGTIEGEDIECPFHGGSFNIITGEPVNPPCVVALRTYPVTVEDGVVFADLSEPGE